MALILATGCTGSPPPAPVSNYNLRIDTAFNSMPVASRHLLIVISPAPSSAPAPSGSQIIVQGSMSMSSAASFTPWTIGGAGWGCTGNWAAFQCTKTLTAPLDYEPLQLFTTYGTQPPGTTVTYIASVSMTGNTDPDPTNNSRTVTHGL